MKLHQKYIRFLRYSLVGGSTFLFDLGLLFLLIDFLGWPPVFSAAASFLTAVSINYAISKKWVFPGSQEQEISIASGFLAVALIGLAIVSIGMYIFTSILHIHYLIARILVALFTGCSSYLVNLYVNFRVAGERL